MRLKRDKELNLRRPLDGIHTYGILGLIHSDRETIRITELQGLVALKPQALPFLCRVVRSVL